MPMLVPPEYLFKTPYHCVVLTVCGTPALSRMALAALCMASCMGLGAVCS